MPDIHNNRYRGDQFNNLNSEYSELTLELQRRNTSQRAGKIIKLNELNYILAKVEFSIKECRKSDEKNFNSVEDLIGYNRIEFDLVRETRSLKRLNKIGRAHV